MVGWQDHAPIMLDAGDKQHIPKIIPGERKRNGLPPMSDEQLATGATNDTEQTVENPVVQVALPISFAPAPIFYSLATARMNAAPKLP
jgi:hypothetical protein